MEICVLGYSALREKVVSCMFRPPELVGPRVKCSMRPELGADGADEEGDETTIAANPFAADSAALL